MFEQLEQDITRHECAVRAAGVGKTMRQTDLPNLVIAAYLLQYAIHLRVYTDAGALRRMDIVILFEYDMVTTRLLQAV